MIWFFAFTFFLGAAIFGTAWWVAHYSELGKDVLQYKCGMTRCPICDEIILKDSHTNDGKVHEWCETYY